MPRRRHTLVPALATVALLAAPALAHADVPLAVPPAFLGGPIAPALAVAPPAANSTPNGAPLSVADPAPAEAAFVGYPCDPEDPPDCVQWTEPADLRNPPDAATAPAPGDAPVAPTAPEVSDPAAVAATAGALIAPAAEAWLPWQTPLLRWSPSKGATHYNVQVFRGTRLVLSAWPRRSRLRVPRGVLDQGRTYVWVVWPGRKTKVPDWAW